MKVDQREIAVRFSDLNPEKEIFRMWFPAIYFFQDEFSLRDELPDRLDETNLVKPSNTLTSAFIDFLGEETVDWFLRSNDPDEREKILEKLQARARLLMKKVNSSRRSKNDSSEALVELVLHAKEGLQLTFKTDGKPSFYRHMSDNTRFLVAYYVHTAAAELGGSILLFDEPNRGFHPTGEEFLLNFLQGLAEDDSQVIVATHSQYLIDPDYIGSVKLMASDSDGYLQVVDNPFRRPTAAGDSLGLQPVFEAIGLRYAQGLALQDRVIVVEGISDLLYIRAFRRVLNIEQELAIAPSRGDSHVRNLLPLLIAQGLSFKLVLDKGPLVRKIMDNYGLPKTAVFEIELPPRFKTFRRSGIEDLFSKEDFQNLLAGVDIEVESDFEQKPNSQCVPENAKRILAQRVLEEPKLVDFSDETLTRFRVLLEFCTNTAWYQV